MPVTIDNRDELVSRYQAGETMGRLGREAGVPWQQVWSVLHAAGVIRWRNGQGDPRRAGQQSAEAETVETATATATAPRQPRIAIINRLTYGIEIECCLPNGAIPVGSYHNGHPIAGLPEGWAAKTDCSINPPTGFRGAEIVSPVLNGADGIRQIVVVCQWLAANGARVNPSTGFHVHVGWTSTHNKLARLVKMVARHEKGLFAVTGTKGREEGRFCRPIAHNSNYALTAGRRVYGRHTRLDRYQSLNLTNLRPHGKRTVEFRLFSGTVNATKIVTYLRICLGLVEKAMGAHPTPEWDFSSANGHAATGEAASRELIEELGWTELGAQFGLLTADGAPSFAAGLQEINRLSRKYDGNDEP